VATLYKISTEGTIGTTPERFVYTQWIRDNNDATTVDDAAAAMAPAVASMLATACASSVPAATLGDLFPDSVVWTKVTARKWNPATNVQIGDPGDSVLTDVAGLGSAAFAFTNQTAFAVSVRTGTTGRRRWNRFYLPPMTTVSRADGDHAHINVAQALSDWLVGLNDDLQAASPQFELVKYSPAAGSAVRLDSTYIGTRYDTQRRRANAEVEVRVQDDFTYV
jgi:hypothetical protein